MTKAIPLVRVTNRLRRECRRAQCRRGFLVMPRQDGRLQVFHESPESAMFTSPSYLVNPRERGSKAALLAWVGTQHASR